MDFLKLWKNYAKRRYIFWGEICVIKKRCERLALREREIEQTYCVTFIQAKKRSRALLSREGADCVILDRRRDHETSGIIAKIAPSSWQSFCSSWRASAEFSMREAALHYSLIVSQIVNGTLRDRRWRKIFAAAFNDNTLSINQSCPGSGIEVFSITSLHYTHIFIIIFS